MSTRPAPPRRFDSLLDLGERMLDSVVVRLGLSVLILISVLPPRVLGAGSDLTPLFLLVFGPEFLLRLLLVERRRRARRLRVSEVALLALDLLALISLLPPVATAGSLRFFRLARLLLLLGHWHELVVDLWNLLSRRDRRYQIALVMVLGFLLALAASVLLIEVGVVHDFDDSGVVDGDDRSFLQILWWSFRQVQDPGNLVPDTADPKLMLLSLALTFAGLLIFSFFVGIGTTVVAELVTRSQSQPLGLSNHTVILGLGDYSEILFHELAEIYRKNLRFYRAAVLGEHEAPEEIGRGVLRHFHYRRGDPSRPGDLERVNIQRAKRAILLGDETAEADASVLAKILAARSEGPTVPLYADLEHERNVPAARAAGGEETRIVASGSMLGFLVAQTVVYPGLDRLYRHLLQPAGCEIYTYVFSIGERRRLRRRFADRSLDVATLVESARHHRTTLIGLFGAEGPDASVEDDALEVLLDPLSAARRAGSSEGLVAEDPAATLLLDGAGAIRVESLRGLVGITPRYRDIAALADSLLGDEVLSRSPSPSEAPPSALDGESDTHDPLGGARLLPDRAHAPERVLILGAGPRVPRVVTQLSGSFSRSSPSGLEVTVIADHPRQQMETAHELLLALRRFHGRAPDLEPGENGSQRLALRCAGCDVRVTVMVADWTHGHRLEDEGAVTLEAADAILLLPPHHGAGAEAGQLGTPDSSDGRIALDCLHLANLERTAGRFRPRVHLLAVVRDPDKGDLLEDRMRAGGAAGRRSTIVSHERTRHRYLMQCVFVRGLDTVYRRLLSCHGPRIGRLVPRDPDGVRKMHGVFEYETLRRHLWKAAGVTLIGYDLVRTATDDGAAASVVVDPVALDAASPRAWSEIDALYVLGDSVALERLGQT